MKTIPTFSVHPRVDERGFVLNLFSEIDASPEEIRDLHVCSLNPGAVRGNHYHENVEEYILVLGGKALLVLTNAEARDKRERRTDGEPVTLIRIDKKTAHAIRNEGDKPLHIICFYISKRPAKVKTVRLPIL